LLLNAIAQGHLTPDEASALSLVAERSMAVISQQEILKRIEVLEKDQELRDATNFKTP
jgi:DNA-binding winged helix-turn-helix (wHTH) protein